MAGLGIAALPDFLTDVPIAEGTLRQVMADYPSPEAGIYVVRPPGGIAPRKVRALIDILIEWFGARWVQSMRPSGGDRGATARKRSQHRSLRHLGPQSRWT
ncbi:LysR substrate-binding domain-containing protein [Mesorhizobium muleiense]|uniref:LysR substrate-binding domain-containing protein n=3 Tax=Mesorhizobium TaxID=68287 RepID=UPI000B870959